MAEQQKRGSSLRNGEHGHSCKRPKAQAVHEDDVLKQGEEEAEVSQGSEGHGAVVAVATMEMEEPQISLMFRVSIFHCQACLFPLKPPTFKCEADHVVCCSCRAKHGEVCSRATTYAPCRELDAVLLDAKLSCQYAEFGCKSLLVYYQAADHHAACRYAPCFCPVPGCKLFTSPARLVEHFRDHHLWPVTGVSYGRPRRLAVPALPQGWHVLVAEGDRSVFLLSPRAHGAATAVSLVCVRASGAAPAAAGVTQFWCKLWAELPSNKDKMVMMTSAVGSSDLSVGFPEADQNMFLVVPPVLLHDASGEAPELMVLIDKAKAAASTTPARRSSRRLQ